MSGRNELALIEEIRRSARSHAALPIGIGDDAALVKVGNSAELLITIDTLMEGVHFNHDVATPQQIGRKSLAVNMSDIAAMAGQPIAAVVGLSLPASRGLTFASDLMRGLGTLADEAGIALAGGDTNVWQGPTVISVTLLGQVRGAGPVRRSGAQSGDWLMVTGALGGSLRGRHLSFQPRVAEAGELHHRAALHAMIDLSDGLATDLRHLLRESQVGAILDGDSIPIHDDVDPALPPEARLHHALSDGEDFELLFAVPPDDGQRLHASHVGDVPVTKIGTITENAGALLMRHNGVLTSLDSTGWEHKFAATVAE